MEQNSRLFRFTDGERQLQNHTIRQKRPGIIDWILHFFAGHSQGFGRQNADVSGITHNNLFFPAIGLKSPVH